MPRPNTPSSLSRVKSGPGGGELSRREKPQQLACDRCRGQKLRCIRSTNSKSPCERCQKASATCITDSGVRMGRPRRADKERFRESSGISHNSSQPKLSPPLPAPPSYKNKTVDFTLNGGAWIVHDTEETTINPTISNFTVEYLDSFGFSPLENSALGNDTGITMAEEHLEPISDLSLGQSIRALAEDEAAATDTTEAINDPSCFRAVRQEALQELSELNMRLSRQLSAVISMAGNYTNIHSSLSLTNFVTPLDENLTLCDTVVFMMHSLHMYHRLLDEMLGSSETAHSPIFSSHDRHDPHTLAASMPSQIKGIYNEELMKQMSEKTACSWRKGLQSDGSAEFPILPDSSHNANLDMPASLLLLSCYTNLIHLCRQSFATIRTALFNKRREINLFAISFFNITDFSIPSDPDLQIIVLIQAVVRMIEKIGYLLGFPSDFDHNSGSEKRKGDFRGSALPPLLLNLVLRGEVYGEGPTDKLGIKALREEIRGVNELVYKPV